MLDIANYRTLNEQYEILKKELKNFSNELSKRSFAIALSRVDTMTKDEANKKISEFLKKIKLKCIIYMMLGQFLVLMGGFQ